MNEDIGGEDAALTDAAGDAAAWALLGRASREKADAYLDEQSSLIRLQKEHLHEQRLLQLSHLKWRRFDDQLKGALQIMLVALSAVVVLAIGTAMWNASRADGLVIDAFSVPPSFAQTGLSGEVVADDMTAKLAAVRRFAMEHSFSTSKDVSKNEKDQIRVEIPDAGISISEALRYLRAWLGNERHANGNVRDLGNGQIALVVNVSGLTPVTVTGKAVRSRQARTRSRGKSLRGNRSRQHRQLSFGRASSDEGVWPPRRATCPSPIPSCSARIPTVCGATRRRTPPAISILRLHAHTQALRSIRNIAVTHLS